MSVIVAGAVLTSARRNPPTYNRDPKGNRVCPPYQGAAGGLPRAVRSPSASVTFVTPTGASAGAGRGRSPSRRLPDVSRRHAHLTVGQGRKLRARVVDRAHRGRQARDRHGARRLDRPRRRRAGPPGSTGPCPARSSSRTARPAARLRRASRRSGRRTRRTASSSRRRGGPPVATNDDGPAAERPGPHPKTITVTVNVPQGATDLRAIVAAGVARQRRARRRRRPVRVLDADRLYADGFPTSSSARPRST